MENNDYFTEKIAPKKNNANPKQGGKSVERPEKPRRKEFQRKPKGESAGSPPIDLALTAEDNSPKVEIIGVRFKDVGKVYYFAPKGEQFRHGESAIVETARGVECGEVVLPNRDAYTTAIQETILRLVRSLVLSIRKSRWAGIFSAINRCRFGEATIALQSSELRTPVAGIFSINQI